MIQSVAMKKFSFTKFLKRWKTPELLRHYLRLHGYDELTIFAIRKWYEREAISVEWALVLLACMEEDDGKPHSIRQYLA